MAVINGTAANDYVHPNDGTVLPGYNNLPQATDNADIFVGGDGGDDFVKLAGGDDVFQFETDLTAADLLDGGAGNDELSIGKAAFVNFTASGLTSVERIVLHNFPVLVGSLAIDHLTFVNENIAAGANLLIDGSVLGPNIAMEVDFSAETDANAVTVIGGAAGDFIRGRISGGFSDYIDLSAGGADDVASAGEIYFGAAYDAADKVDGKSNARIRLDGDYSGGLTLTAPMVKNLGSFLLGPAVDIGNPRHDYIFTIAANAIAPSDGGFGFDASGQHAGSVVYVDASAVTTGNKSFDIVGSPGNETLLGGSGLDIFQLFGAGADRFSGNDGSDWVSVNNNNGRIGGDDVLDGGLGSDTLYVGSFSPDVVVYDGVNLASFERIVADSNLTMMSFVVTDNALPANRKLTIDWSAVTSEFYTLTLNGSAETDGRFEVIGGAAGDRLVTGGGNDTVKGGGGNDTITGNAGNDSLVGGDGADVLRGGPGADELRGGLGNDTFINPVLTGPDADTIIESANGGTDKVESNATFSLASLPNVERLVLTGVNAINGTGNAAANLIVGNAQANILTGLEGNDTLDGGDGADRLIGGPGADLLRGGAGDDTYVGVVLNGAGADTIEEAAAGGIDTIETAASATLAALPQVERLTLTGTADINGAGNDLDNLITGNGGRNTLSGGTGNDTLNGGAGKDILIGGKNSDVMNGGSGADTFRFAASNTGSDTIDGFETSLDKFDLSGGSFTAIQENGGNTRLTHAGGNIIITGVTGLSLGQWNALVLPPGGAASERAGAADEGAAFHFVPTAIDALFTQPPGLPLLFVHADFLF